MRSRINSDSITNACQIFLILSLCFSTSYAAAPPMPSSSNSTLIEEECKSEFAKVGLCLDFATGKAKTPPKDCCATIDDIRQENEVCLCYVIQQVHQGGSSLKELGVQESKLLELPKACKLDVKLEDCPKLLHLNSTSPDNAIFTNSSTASSAAEPTHSSQQATVPEKKNTSSSARFVRGSTLRGAIFITILINFMFFSA
ncbi:hypothetical protein MKW98_006865 [Papaver atlanticum]|uniref:Bifunctional inhibitor/plant lipid transfer protein/seed storage helical domain-containing protein n=1 Tax=Papaver atlanticum TaxID=357466 RepID=A0AAD4SUP1_9MAGN|nr:hypothetical protein MKW98_006865 [Papaver atlanticum]